MSFKKEEIDFNMNADFTSDWIYLNKERKSLIDTSVIHTNYDSITGTEDGSIVVEQLFGDDEAKDFDTLSTINVDETSAKTTLKKSVPCFACRIKYTKNSITGGNGRAVLILTGK